jgi:hypothetical protein
MVVNMLIQKKTLRREVYSLQQHHKNVLKKVEKMKSKCEIAGIYLDKNISKSLDAMSALFQVFHESIQELNEDKKYFLEKLKFYNEVSENLRSYVKELNEIAIEVLNTNKNDKNYDEATIIDHTINRIEKIIGDLGGSYTLTQSSQGDRENDIKNQLGNVKTDVLQIKQKLLVKKPEGLSIRKPSLVDKKLIKKRK